MGGKVYDDETLMEVHYTYLSGGWGGGDSDFLIVGTAFRVELDMRGGMAL